MSARKFLILNPFLTYGLIGALIQVTIEVINIGYDDGGLRGLIFVVSLLFDLPYRVAQEILYAAGGHEFLGFDIYGLMIGIALCLAVDVVYRKARAEHRKDMARKQ